MKQSQNIMWLVYDEEGLARNPDYVKMYERLCQPYCFMAKAVLVQDVVSKIEAGERPKFVLVRVINPEINQYLEEQGISVYNSSFVSRICNHKGNTLEYLKEFVLSVPSVTLCVDMLTGNWDNDVAMFKERYRYSESFMKEEQDIINHASDYVVKAVDGHGGKEVFSLRHEYPDIKRKLKNEDVVLQPMISPQVCGDIKRSRDLRVYVIGTRMMAAVMRSSDVDFRANYSRGGHVCLYELMTQEKEIVEQIIQQFQFGMVGIDFILDADNRLILNEIEDVVGARMLYQCNSDIDIAKEYLAYIMEKELEML